MRGGIGHIRGIDGLRALSALGVVGHHLKLPGFEFGWTGVYLFFVISGFLITRILIHDKGRPDYFTGFLTRRAVRIFPIYYLLLFAVLLFCLATRRSVAEWPWFFFYLQNFRLAASIDFPLVEFLSHTWTLAVEEQFYWLWPFVVLLAPTRWISPIAIAIILAAWAWRTVVGLFWYDPILIASPLPCAMDFLAWGALAATWPDKDQPWRLATALVLGAALVVLWLAWPLVLSRGLLFLGLLAPLFLGAMVIGTTVPAITVVLELRWLRYIGRISYGLYLYHIPLFFMADRLADHGIPVSSAPVKVALAIAVAALSYELVERPLLARKGQLSAMAARRLSNA